MRLAVDASVLVGELLRRRGRALVADPRLELYVAEATYGEARHELLNRQRLLVQHAGLAPEVAAALVKGSLETAEAALTVASDAWLEPFRQEALARVPADPDDWPTAALALALGVGVWTDDRDFFGSGLATWQTPVLQYALTTEAV